MINRRKKHMKIQYKKFDTEQPWGENAREIIPQFHVIEQETEEKKPMLELYIASKGNESITYMFTVYPDSEHGTLTGLLVDISAALYAKTIEGIDGADMGDVIRSVTIVNGILAERMEESKPLATKLENGNGEEIDPTNKVFYRMINGTVLVSDATQINWENNIRNLPEINQMANNIRHLIHIMLTQKEYKPNENAENTIPVEELIDQELSRFYEINKIDIDYSMYDNDITTEREVKIARLIDIMEIYTQLILVSSIINAQNDVIRQITKGPSDEELQKMSEDAKYTVEEIKDVEVVEGE